MATKLLSMQWADILQNKNITRPLDLSIFQALYSFSNRQGYASQIGQLLVVPTSSLNLEVWRYAERIAKLYPISFSKHIDGSTQYWSFFFEGWDEGRFFVWQLKPEIAEALAETGLTGEEQFGEELSEITTKFLFEGAKKSITVNSYERNPIARQQCIKFWEARCSVCDFNFEAVYGALGKDFIHIHHLTPISQVGIAYQIDPIKDLRPVCPNCHAMLHRQEPPLTIEELQLLIHQQKQINPLPTAP